jgi:DNA-binding NarL/FixJ family response regulator
MKRMLATMGGVELVGSFRNVAKVLNFVQNRDVDLAILKIKIAEDDGLELAGAHRLSCINDLLNESIPVRLASVKRTVREIAKTTRTHVPSLWYKCAPKGTYFQVIA